MVYPSCLVLLPLSDLPVVVPQGSANTSGSLCGAQQGQSAHRDPAMSSVTLTPPTSPEEAQTGTSKSFTLTNNTHIYPLENFPNECVCVLFCFFLALSCIDYQLAQRWLKLSSASDGYSSSNTLHGGKIPHRLASQMVETVWQEYNINRTGHKYVQACTGAKEPVPV